MWKIVGTLALMVVSGIVTLAVTITYLMNLGMKRHDNYEYYAAFVWGPAVIGFLAPGVVVWVLWFKSCSPKIIFTKALTKLQTTFKMMGK